MQVRSLGQEDPLKEGMVTHSSILAWRVLQTEELTRLWSMGLQNWTWLKWLSTCTRWEGNDSLHRSFTINKGKDECMWPHQILCVCTHSSVPAWRIPGMGEPGGLPSLESHRVGHDWSDLAAAAVYQKNIVTMEKIFLVNISS